ncbi:tetratricopeptide (TPR) repeat protein [Nocardia sp. GAS34]|uniref:hypothetical protein n=1 Tax=unclassified Nocardia TaxID=2637762 RepID=UPI003D1F0DDA
MTSGERIDGAEPGAPESSAESVAKSSVWQGLLRIASVFSTSMLLELISKLLEKQVGESPALTSVSSWLSRIAVLLVLAAAGYVLVRQAIRTWEHVWAQRELRLTADLISPGAPVRSWPSAIGAEPEPPVRQVNRDPQLPAGCDDRVLKVLSALPFDRYETAALYDLVSAVLTARQRLPKDAPADRNGSAAREIEGLIGAGILARDTRDRLRVVCVLPADMVDGIADGPEWGAALQTLVGHHADRATRWAAALDTGRLGAGARRWFEQEDAHLIALIRDCREIGRSRLSAAVPELIRLADALDRWYARNGWSAAKDGLALSIAEITTPADEPVEHELARVRLGARDVESAVSWLHRYKSSLVARRDQGEAMQRLREDWTDEATRVRALEGAAALLERAWGRVPARDVAGAVCILVDLAIVRLHLGSLDAARNCLGVAQSLAADDRDPAGLAHVYETMGVLRWQRGEARRALHDWQRALTRYRDLDHALGIARCLQHLGSAMALVPEYGGLLLNGSPGRGEVLRQAGGWLAHAGEVRPRGEYGVPDAPLTVAAQVRVRDRLLSEPGLFDPGLGSPGPLLLTDVDRWPLPAPEDAPAPADR